MESKPPIIKSYILPIIVCSQFACISLWFAGNAVVPNLIETFQLNNNALGHITSAVQFGFIIGSLLFAILSIADRYSPSKVFMLSAFLGAIANVAILFGSQTLTSLIVLRFCTGFFLAGIYPVGMKIAADYHEKGLGKVLGYLVGALVLGTALPHLIKELTNDLPWAYVLISTSALSILGGLSIGLLIPNGPFRKASSKLQLTAIIKIFKNKQFRAASLGYFGHMWELYTFWAFVPILLTTYIKLNPSETINIPLTSFFVIAIGSVSCILGGYASIKVGSLKIAAYSLLISGMCCLVSPFIFTMPLSLFLLFLFIWGMSVISDSPQFSTLVAQSAPTKLKGTALTIVNTIGFSITILSIQVISFFSAHYSPLNSYALLVVGPLLGLFAIKKMNTK